MLTHLLSVINTETEYVTVLWLKRILKTKRCSERCFKACRGAVTSGQKNVDPAKSVLSSYFLSSLLLPQLFSYCFDLR